MLNSDLDSADRFAALKLTILKKGSLRRFYEEVYQNYKSCLNRCVASSGLVLELGSGGGFAKQIIPELITSDIIPYPEIDRVVDGTKMPFDKETVKAIFMFNVFHHIPDVEAFLNEASRCLIPGGRMLIVDQNAGLISGIILRYFHHESYLPDAETWKFESLGPLSSANGALAWIVFVRDRERFEKLFPMLKILAIRPHSPFRYWLCGGLKRWNFLPDSAFGIASFVDNMLIKLFPFLGGFFDIEIEKI